MKEKVSKVFYVACYLATFPGLVLATWKAMKSKKMLLFRG